jgi:hypothetical protein
LIASLNEPIITMFSMVIFKSNKTATIIIS